MAHAIDQSMSQSVTIDPTANHVYRVDSFAIPDAAREEFEATMQRNLAFLHTLPGFLGHVVLEKTSGPTGMNVVTIAAWESPAAIEKAGAEVRAHYQQIGFDLAATLARWGARAEIGAFTAAPASYSPSGTR
jgi:heme oxygenase (mycobilin-producing)